MRAFIRVKYMVAFLLLASSSGRAQTIFLWTEVNPEWKKKATDYWLNANGYGKKLPGQCISQIKDNNAFVSNDVGLKLQKAIIASNVFKNVQRSPNPTDIYAAERDMFLDLSAQVKEVTPKYPYFKKEFAKVEPTVEFRLRLYGCGKMVLDTVISRFVDYKASIKPQQRTGITEYEQTVDEPKFAILTAFDRVSADLVTVVKRTAERTIAPAGTDVSGGLHSEVTILFSDRKNRYPQDYTFTLSSAPSSHVESAAVGVSRGSEADERVAFGDKEMAAKLSENLRGVKYYSLFIGVADYTDPKINDLENPISDARRLRDLLVQQYTFPREDALLLENPTQSQVIQALDQLAAKLTKKDNLLIFYAGHGLYDQQMKSGYWLLKDASPGSRANWLSNSTLRDYIGGINSKHTLLIADACFSGGIFKMREAFSGLTQADVELYTLPSRKAMTSGAMKTVPDKSVFIEYLVKRLTENPKPFISSEQLFASFKNAVINNSPNGQVPQFGEIRETGDEGGDFIFARRKN